jgi:hypothetical protein
MASRPAFDPNLFVGGLTMRIAHPVSAGHVEPSDSILLSSQLGVQDRDGSPGLHEGVLESLVPMSSRAGDRIW